jgi:beta-N-acetylhexosaminidase
VPLIISVDMEGGRVARLKEPLTVWPPLRKLGDLDSTSLAFKFAHSMGIELRALGFNVDYAPCVDVFTNPRNEIIGDRSLSSDPERVAKLASAIVRGYIKAQVEPCAKHFPGHGNTLLDSHFELPIETKTLEELRLCEMIPFKKTIRARLNLVMMAHILYSAVDSEWPASLSSKWIQDVLRGELRFKGIVISDDLDMKALTNHYDKTKIAIQALKAGSNVLLYCNEPQSPREALELVEKAVIDKNLDSSIVEANYQMMLNFKKERFAAPFAAPNFEVAKAVIGHAEHQQLSDAIRSGIVPPDLFAQANLE